MFWDRGNKAGPIGLIAGHGDFPLIVARAAASLKKEVIAFGVEEYTDKRIEALVKETHYVELGSPNTLVDLLKKSKIKKVVLAGGIPKKQIYNPNFKLDEAAQGFFRGKGNKGDDHLLKAFELFLKVKAGVSVVDSRSLLKDVLAPRGVLTKRSPTEAEWNDLRLGYQVAKGVGKMDIGQTVVVKQGVVLAVEALEGTDQAIRRGGELGHGETVVVKAAKPNQDLRFDLPCVGLETIETLKTSSSRVLGIEAGKTLMLFKEKVIEAANRENITIVGL